MEIGPSDHMKKWFSELKSNDRIFAVFIFVLFIAASVFTLFYMGVDSFHHDELYSIGFFSKNNSFSDMMRIFLTDEVTNPPLYYIFMYFWYRIVPSTETWLLIPNYFIFLTGLLALSGIVMKYTGKISCVFILFVIAWINAYTFGFMIFNLRAYCLLFMFSSLVISLYDRSLQDQSYKNSVIFGLLLFCMCFTHYYGILVSTGYGLLDLYLVIKHRKDLKKSLLPYVVLLFLISPYLIIAFINRKKQLSQFWGMLPSPLRVIKTIAQFFGNEYLFIVFVLMAGICFLVFLKSGFPLERSSFWKSNRNLLYIACVWVSFFTFMVSYIYSYWINPGGGIYVEQYFISVKPLFLLIFSFLCGYITDMVSLRLNSGKTFFFTILLSLLILFLALFGGNKWYKRHLFKIPTTRNLADHISADLSGHPDNTAAIYIYQAGESQWNVGKYPASGLKEFYLDPKDINIPILLYNDDFTGYDRVYVWYEIFNMFDENVPSVDPVLETMEGYHLSEDPLNTGIWTFEKDQ